VQSRRESLAGFLCVARYSAVQRRPGIAGSGIRSENKLSNRIPGPATCALGERRPRHLSSLFNKWEGCTSPNTHEREERQNRRAVGTATGENPANDECSLSEVAGFSPVTGDPIACRSANTERNLVANSASAPLRLCDFASLRSFLGGWVALRLCGSATLRSFWCSPLVAWCLGGEKDLSFLA